MNASSRPRVITLEEHYLDPEVNARFGRAGPMVERMLDFTGVRLAEMDAAGIDMQVLSHAPPGLQRVPAEDAPDLARRVNDRLHAEIERNPARFAGFASLPTTAPEHAADELERAVTRLGFKGAMIHGLTNELFIDDKRFWPILAQAEALGVPLYIHPAEPHPGVNAAYFGEYAKTHPMFVRAAWGFTFETGTQAMRLVLSGAFEAFPKLRIILGHLGEAIPFLLARIDEALSRDTPMKNFRAVFSEHFYVTTSGFFSDPALLCCIQELGADRIMFSIDWPFASEMVGTQWFSRLQLNAADKAKILSGNAERLLRL